MSTPENTNNSGTKTWVTFDEDSPEGKAPKESQENSSAIIKAESTRINIENGKPDGEGNGEESAGNKTAAVITPEFVHINVGRTSMNRSVQLESQNNPTSTNSKIPDSSKSGLKNVDLRENVNGNSVGNSRISNIGNAVIRQGFG